MKILKLFIILVFISSGICAQNQLIWSDDFDLENNGHSGKDPKLELKNDSVRVLDIVHKDGHSMLLRLFYNLDGDLLSNNEIAKENNDTTEYSIVDFVEDAVGDFYVAKRLNISYNKDKFTLERYSDEGIEIWKQEQFSVADTSFTPINISILKDSLLLISYIKSFGYPLDETQVDTVFSTQEILFSCFDLSGNNLWNLDLDSQTSNYTIVTIEDSWILFENSSNTNIVKLDTDGAHSIIQSYDFYIGPQNIKVTSQDEIVFSNSLRYRYNLLNVENGEIKSFEYPTNLPVNNFGDRIEAIVEDEEGNVYSTGRLYGTGSGTSSYTNCDVLTLKFDSDGNLEWENTYMHGLDNCDIGNVIKVKGNYVYVGGRSANSGTPSPYDYFVLKLDKDTGENMGLYRYDAGNGSDDFLKDLIVFNDGSLVLTGITSPANWTTQYLSDLIINSIDEKLKTRIQLFPNPMMSGTFLNIESDEQFNTYEIYSVSGVLAQKGNLQNDQKINLKLSSGEYFIKLESMGKYITKTIVVE